MRNFFRDLEAANQVSEAASATICTFNMANWEGFDVTIRCSSSSGFQYNIYGSPTGDSSIQVLVTGASGVTDFGAACGTIRSTIRDNYLTNFWIEAQATAAAREVSATNIRIFITALDQDV